MAAIYGNVVQIYSTTTFDNVSNLKGHNGKVRSVAWSSDDQRLVTCGVDGAVYEWDALTGRRLAENVLKSCSYNGVALTPDAKTTFAVGSDHTLKEISDSQVSRCPLNCYSNVVSWLASLLRGGGYNYDSTSIRRPFDGRPTACQRSLSSRWS